MKPLFNSVYVTYSATFGKCDGSDEVDWGEVDLFGTDAEEYTKACMTHTPVEEMDSLAEVRNNIYDTIIEQEIESYHDMYDEDDDDYEEDPEFYISIEYSLNEPDDDEVIEYIEACLEGGDMELAERVFEEFEPADEEDEFVANVLLAAVRADSLEFVKNHYQSVDLNPDEDDVSPFVEEAESDEMIELLISLGANDYPEDDEN